jgi:hypothetical protein
MMGMMATASTAGGGGGDIATTRLGGAGAGIIGIDFTVDGTTGTADVTVTMVGVALADGLLTSAGVSDPAALHWFT